MSPPNRAHGFTLMEILIALFIFSIVAMIMVNALHSVLTSQSSTEKHAARLAEIQLALTLLSRDLEQTIERPITNTSGTLEAPFIGTNHTITFTHAGLSNPLGQQLRSTLQRTRYRFEDAELWRDTWSQLDRTTQTPLNRRALLTAIDKLQFEYLDQKGHFQMRWPPGDASQEPAALPRAVRVSLTLHDAGQLTQLYIIPGQKIEKTTT